MESNDDNRATCLGAPVLPESCGAGTNLAPMGESTVLHPAEHPLVHSTAFPTPQNASVEDLEMRQCAGPSAWRARTQRTACSLDLLLSKSHPLWCGDHMPSQKAPCPSIPALSSTECRQQVMAATAEQVLQLHTLVLPRCRQQVTAPTSDTSMKTQGRWAPLVLASLGAGIPQAFQPPSLGVYCGALLPGQQLGNSSSQVNLPSSSAP